MATSNGNQADELTEDVMLPPSTDEPRTLALGDTLGTIDVGYDDEEEPLVYGLDIDIEENESKLSLRTTLRFIVGGIIAAALIIGGLMVIKPFGQRKSGDLRSQPIASKEDVDDKDGEDSQSTGEGEPSDENTQGDATEEDSSDEKEKASEAEKEQETKDDKEESKTIAPYISASDLGTVVTKEDLDKLVHYLVFNGADLSLPEADMSTAIKDNRVEVVHVLHDVKHADPSTLAGKASQRAAALSNILDKHELQGAEGQKNAQFNDILWRVVDVNGNTFIALSFYAGYTPSTGEPLWVLAQSPYYCMSDSLYKKLEQPPSQKGSKGAPKDLDGNEIQATASLDVE